MSTPVPLTSTAESGTLPEPAVPVTAPVRYSVPEAARALGISERAVRKRIDAGTLEATKEGRSWVVVLPTIVRTARSAVPAVPVIITMEPGTGTGPEAAVPDAVPAIDLTPLVEAMERQSKEIQRVTEAATAWQFRAMRAEDRLMQLTAGEGAPQAVSVAPDGPDQVDVGVRSSRSSATTVGGWWRWLMGRR